MTTASYLCVFLLIIGHTPALADSAEGLGVSQHPPSLTLLQGQKATLSCLFEVESDKYGVNWFKMAGDEKLLISDLPGRFSQSRDKTRLVVTKVSLEDSGVYYCELTVSHRDPQQGNGTELIVLAPPSAPQLFLQVPPDPLTGQWALLCVTTGFHPHHLTLAWTRQSTTDDSPTSIDRNCTLQPQGLALNQSSRPSQATSALDWMADNSFFNVTAGPLLLNKCFQVTDSSGQEVGFISVWPLPLRSSLNAGVTFTCSVKDHPALKTPLSTSFTWDADPNEVIGWLNVLKLCVLSGVTMVASLSALEKMCKKKRPVSLAVK